MCCIACHFLFVRQRARTDERMQELMDTKDRIVSLVMEIVKDIKAERSSEGEHSSPSG